MFTHFNDHHDLEGKHATFSPSQSYWLRYDDKKIALAKKNKKASELGTRLHAWAKETIDLGIVQPFASTNLGNYVNDAIGFGMSTEVPLYFSDDFFGTADAISFHNNFLRIHDLKTGEIPANMEQLMVYAALFCLEYSVNPKSIMIELRIYQQDQPEILNPNADDILVIMNTIKHFDSILHSQPMGV